MKSMHVKVTDTLGRQIVNGDMPADTVLSLAGIETRVRVPHRGPEAMLRLQGSACWTYTAASACE